VARAVAGAVLPDRLWIIAIGKAAVPMARGALSRLEQDGRRPTGGLVVAPRPLADTALGLPVLPGDHPLPDAHSLHAAEAIGALVREVHPRDDVWVLLSGGTSSLIGAPVPGGSLRVLREVFRSISQSGLDITEANEVRRRFLRWGGGRLGAALSHAAVRVFAVSDVPGDDPTIIGSGPCAPDPLFGSDVKARLQGHDLLTSLPREVLEMLDGTIAGTEPETPKPHQATQVPHHIVLRNADALAAAAAEARRRNYFADIVGTLEGEARDLGALLGQRVRDAAPGGCLLWGGESTVTLGTGAGHGGRSQELALSAARAMAGGSASLLAAGTDGRDGPTDAAGAIVDGTTLDRLRAAGHDPEAALERHNAYPALDSAGALFRPGLTGTNVMDVVIALRPR
jgi:hydroxypyruvate reductase